MPESTPGPLRAFFTKLPVLLLLVIAALGWGFLALADAVGAGHTGETDRSILLALRHPDDLADAIGPAWLEKMMRDFTALGSTGVLTLTVLSTAIFLWLSGKRRAVALILVTVVTGTFTGQLMKAGYDRPRPDLVPHGSIAINASFPSGHSLMAATVYLTLGLLLARVNPHRPIRILVVSTAVLVTVLVGVSRVYLGVHWPTDVLAGWTVGAAIALLATGFLGPPSRT